MPAPEIPSGGVTISDLYHELVALRQDVAAALNKMERVQERSAAVDRGLADHEARVRILENAIPSSLEVRIMALEKFRWQIAGALVTIQVLAVVVEYFLWSVKK